MTVQGPVKEQQPDGMSHMGLPPLPMRTCPPLPIPDSRGLRLRTMSPIGPRSPPIATPGARARAPPLPNRASPVSPPSAEWDDGSQLVDISMHIPDATIGEPVALEAESVASGATSDRLRAESPPRVGSLRADGGLPRHSSEHLLRTGSLRVAVGDPLARHSSEHLLRTGSLRAGAGAGDDSLCRLGSEHLLSPRRSVCASRAPGVPCGPLGVLPGPRLRSRCSPRPLKGCVWGVCGGGLPQLETMLLGFCYQCSERRVGLVVFGTIDAA